MNYRPVLVNPRQIQPRQIQPPPAPAPSRALRPCGRAAMRPGLPAVT